MEAILAIINKTREMFPDYYLFSAIFYFLLSPIARKSNVDWFNKNSFKILLCIGLFGLYILMAGYCKPITIYAEDYNGEALSNASIILNKTPTSLPNGDNKIELKIKNRNFPHSLKLVAGARKGNSLISKSDFIEGNSIHLRLDKPGHIVACNDKSDNIRLAYPLYSKCDIGGTDLLSSKLLNNNYVVFYDKNVKSFGNFGIKLKSILFEPNSSLFIEVYGAFKIQLGEGTMQLLRVETNKTRQATGWQLHEMHQLEHKFRVGKPISLFINFTHDSINKHDISINLFNDDIDEPTITYSISGLSFNKQSNIRIGSISKTNSADKILTLRLLEIETNN